MKLKSPFKPSKKNKKLGKFKPKSFFRPKFLIIFILMFGAIGGLVVYRSFAATTVLAGNAGEFHPLNPARVMDTRNGIGGYKVALKANSEYSLLLNGRGGVPKSNVAAVSLNLTATGTQRDGFMTVYPSGSRRPNTSSINFSSGQTVANSATVRVGTDGRVRIFNGSSGTVHVIVDVSGYFSTKDGPNGLRYLNRGIRVLDTRSKLGATGAIPAKGEIVLKVGAKLKSFEAYSYNKGIEATSITLTAVNASSPGFVIPYPSGTKRPNVSALNFSNGDTIANTVTVKLGSDGNIRLYNGSNSPLHLIADIDAAFFDRARSNTSTDGKFVPVNPYRALDTRSGLGGKYGPVSGNGVSFSLKVTGKNGLPNVARGVVANVTAIQSSAPGYISLSAGRTSIINYRANQVIAANSNPGLGGGQNVTLKNGGSQPVNLLVDIYGYYSL